MLRLLLAGCIVLAFTACAASSAPTALTGIAPLAAAHEVSSSVSKSTATPGQSMWLWTTSSEPYPTAASVMKWSVAHNVKSIFLCVNLNSAGAVEYPAAIAAYAATAKKDNIVLYALQGDPSYITTPGKIETWETAVMATGDFSGIHLDEEPNEVTGWLAFGTAGATAADNPIMNQMYAMIASLRANSPSTHLEFDIQFGDTLYTSADGYATDGYGSFGEALVALSDETTVMSYRTTDSGSNGVAAISAPLLALATAHAKPMRLGLETTQDTSDPQDSFYGGSESTLKAVLTAIGVSEASSSAYAGTSIEDYAGWIALTQ